MSDEWTKTELRSAVETYLEMQRKTRDGQLFIKKSYYELLANKHGRTAKSVEYRMQNISYVLSLMGRDWLIGLKPARNVGVNIASEIEALIAEVEGRKNIPIVAFESEVRHKRNRENLPKPSGNQNPRIKVTEVTQFQRDVSVKAWILQFSNGKCGVCGKFAPFNGTDGFPYLEVHHIRHLADGGSDTTSNVIAVCPNCHRELHYGENAQNLVDHLYERINRLIRE